MSRDRRPIVVTPRFLEEYARRWVRVGFEMSGEGFNGETPRLVDSRAFESMFDAAFRNAWARRRDRE